ncbi:MAG: hypothetical protein UZ22_OP11002001084 [Microgenomates bacterium OLB23]|nr:MAG: hypothetical protein UZ22_OP11002001084 [Microgenomates bacterium OLB23]
MPRTKDTPRTNLILSVSFLILCSGLVVLALIFFPIAQQELRYYAQHTRTTNSATQEIAPVDEEFGIVVPKNCC